MDKISRKLCSSMGYNAYNFLYGSLDMVGYTLLFMNFLLFRNNALLNISNSLTSILFWSYSLYLNKFNGYMYTKDISKIMELYNCVVKNYNRLNKDFEIDDPISMSVMFNYMLYNGYLSNNKEFVFSEKNVLMSDPIRGCNIIIGNGVCRHISSMFCDILNDKGLDSVNIGCYVRNLKTISVVETSKDECTRDEFEYFVRNNVDDLNNQEKLLDCFDALYEIGIFVKLKNVYEDVQVKKVFGANHLICFTRYNGNNYYLDPTQGRVYRLNEFGHLYDSFDDRISIDNLVFKEFNDIRCNALRKMKDDALVKGNFIDLAEERFLISATKEICENNRDLFDKFYNDNRFIYEEIYSCMKKIKGRRIR